MRDLAGLRGLTCARAEFAAVLPDGDANRRDSALGCAETHAASQLIQWAAP